MVNEIKSVKVDGVVVTIPKEEKAYLIVEHPLKGRVIEPFEKVPVEKRIEEVIGRVAEALKGKEEVVKTKKKEVI